MTNFSSRNYAQLLDEVLFLRREMGKLTVKLNGLKDEIERRANLESDFERVQIEEVKRMKKKEDKDQSE